MTVWNLFSSIPGNIIIYAADIKLELFLNTKFPENLSVLSKYKTSGGKHFKKSLSSSNVF